jgi:hypothetical protein
MPAVTKAAALVFLAANDHPGIFPAGVDLKAALMPASKIFRFSVTFTLPALAYLHVAGL